MLTFTYSIYILFALAALSAVIAIWLFVANARVSGFLSLIVGLALAGMTLFMWSRFDAPDGSGQALAEARETIRTQTGTISGLEASLKQSEDELAALRRLQDKAGDDAGRLRELQDKLAAANERVRLEILRAERGERRSDELQKELATLNRDIADAKAARDAMIQNTAHQLDLLLERARRSRVELGAPLSAEDMPEGRSAELNQRRVELLDREIRRLGLEVETVAAPGLSEELKSLKDRMAYGFTTDDYEVEVYPDNEVIKGQKGSYYVIDLKDAETGTKFDFKAGKYTLDRSDRKFRQALSVFMRDVMEKLEGNTEYQLMVRGSADAAAFRGQQSEGYLYSEISYLPEVEDGRYLSKASVRQLDRKIVNADLPFLRARYLKDLVANVYPTKEADVLEGRVSRKINERDRNAELMLFIHWE